MTDPGRRTTRRYLVARIIAAVYGAWLGVVLVTGLRVARACVWGGLRLARIGDRVSTRVLRHVHNRGARISHHGNIPTTKGEKS